MKQEDKRNQEKSLELLEDLKKQRGGSLLGFHKKCANIPELLTAFNQQYAICNKECSSIPRKYRELILMVLGCSKGVDTTVRTHARLAMENGASIEEIGEALRLVFFYCGASELIPAVEIFEELPGSEGM